MKLEKLELINTPSVEQVAGKFRLRYPLLARRTKQLVFSEKKFYDNVVKKVESPAWDKLSIFFITGLGSKKCGFKPHTECFVIDSKLYRRLSWGDVDVQTTDGHKRQNGMSARSSNKLVYFVVEIEMTDEIQESIAEAI